MKKHLSVVFLIVFGCHALACGEASNQAVAAFEDQHLGARPLPLNAVRLTGGPLKRAQDVTAAYLLALEPDRMMAGYRLRAGLEPKADGYGGWDSIEGRQLTGHAAGHYLSGISLMYAATGDERFKERIDYLVAEMKEVQDKRGTGYLGAMADRSGTDCEEIMRQVSRGIIRSAGFDLNGLWVPWYAMHKTFAGLRDAYRFAGNQTALAVEIRFAEWADSILSPMNDTQIQQMLNAEHGGMNEVMVDLYADTGDKRWLELSYKFHHRSIIQPLQRHQDNLPGKHGNTQVPKIVGLADRFAYAGTASDILAAGFFWDRVVRHHSFSTGGHGQNEHFGQPDRLTEIMHGRTCETCNVYNMLKLTRRLFAIEPDAHYADFHERALFNHILASIDPNDGRTCYMVPVGQSVQQEYQDMFRSFTCCVGTGMESHGLHADGLYYEADDTLWVNLYAPSTADWAEAGVRLTMETPFPEGDSATLKLNVQSPRQFTLALRKPYWVDEGFAVTVNGRPVPESVLDPYRDVPLSGRRGAGAEDETSQLPGSFVRVMRTWNDGDTVEIALPKTLRLEPMADDPSVAAILWGPLVLAGDLGPAQPGGRRRGGDDSGPRIDTPVLVTNGRPVAEWVQTVDGQESTFRTVGVAHASDGSGPADEVTLVPFYRLHNRTYATYWNLFTGTDWQAKKAEYAAELERRRRLEAATVAYVQPGEMQPERDFDFLGGDDAAIARAEGRPGRRAGSWFSFDIPVDPARPMALVVTYYSGERRRGAASFEILVDGQRIAEQTAERTDPARFYEVEYAIDNALIQSKEKVTVRFQAAADGQVAGIYGIRMIRADAER